MALSLLYFVEKVGKAAAITKNVEKPSLATVNLYPGCGVGGRSGRKFFKNELFCLFQDTPALPYVDLTIGESLFTFFASLA